MDFKAQLDTSSLQQIIRLQGFAGLLNPEIREALIEGGGLIARTAAGNARRVFTHNSPGGLADNIYPWLTSQTELEIRVAKIHGRRREYGFTGMTDSLGRFYPYDPAKPYLAPAMEQEGPIVEKLFQMAVNHALGRVASG
jgi:hypothetical protein